MRKYILFYLIYFNYILWIILILLNWFINILLIKILWTESAQTYWLAWKLAILH